MRKPVSILIFMSALLVTGCRGDTVDTIVDLSMVSWGASLSFLPQAVAAIAVGKPLCGGWVGACVHACAQPANAHACMPHNQAALATLRCSGRALIADVYICMLHEPWCCMGPGAAAI